MLVLERIDRKPQLEGRLYTWVGKWKYFVFEVAVEELCQCLSIILKEIKRLLGTCAKNQNVAIVDCVIHREAVVFKAFPPNLLSVMSQVIQMVNSMKSWPLQTQLFLKTM